MVRWLSGWIAGGEEVDLRGNKDDSCHVVANICTTTNWETDCVITKAVVEKRELNFVIDFCEQYLTSYCMK